MANPLEGPAVGNSRRKRNTVANKASKGGYGGYGGGGFSALGSRGPGTAGGGGPAVYGATTGGAGASTGVGNPASTAAYASAGDQLAAARYGYLAQLAALKNQGAGINAQFSQDVTAAKQMLPGQLAAIEGDAMDRGVLGSSADLSGRADAFAQRTTSIAQAKTARALGLQQVQAGKMGAEAEYFMNTSSVKNALLQSQLDRQTQAYAAQLAYSSDQAYYSDLIAGFKDALAAFKTGNTPRNRNGLNIPEWRQRQANQAGFGNDVGGFLQHIWGDKLGI